MEPNPEVLLAIDWHEKLIPYLGPIPAKGAIISFEDGRMLRVNEILYKGVMVISQESTSVIVNKIIIAARFV